MPTKKTIFMLFVAIAVFSIISWDYTSGHTVQDLMDHVWCPICDSFMSVAIDVLLIFFAVFIGFVPALCCVFPDCLHAISVCFDPAVTPDRAPPICV